MSTPQTTPNKTYAKVLAEPIEVADRILQVAASALEAAANRRGGVLHELVLSSSEEGTSRLSYRWPGGLSITGPAGQGPDRTRAALAHWQKHVRDLLLLRVGLDLSGEATTYRAPGGLQVGGGPAVATFDSDGRVTVRDARGKLLAASLPGEPFRLKPHRA